MDQSLCDDGEVGLHLTLYISIYNEVLLITRNTEHTAQRQYKQIYQQGIRYTAVVDNSSIIIIIIIIMCLSVFSLGQLPEQESGFGYMSPS